MLMTADESTFDNITFAFVGIVAIQIALVDLLVKMGIRADGILGHSVGELACAYADGCLTAEETLLAAYWRGHCITNAKLPTGGMAAVGLTWKDAIDQCPEGVVAACHNAYDTVTISGAVEPVRAFVQQLKSKNIFAKDVNSAGIAFHSHHMADIAKEFNEKLKEVIIEKRPRTSRWVSSSIPQDRWDSELARWSSADYHANNVVSPVLFHDALQQVPDNAVVIEIAPHALLQAILRRSLSKNCSIVGLMKKNHDDNIDFFLSNLGKCYQNGVELNPTKLCAPVSFPVSPGTPMISSILRWDHSQTWNTPTYDSFTGGSSGKAEGFDFDVSEDGDDHYLTGHVIDGRALFPATGYLVLAWKQLAKLNGTTYDEMAVSFDNVEIRRATMYPPNGKLHFDVTLMQGTGYFEIREGEHVVSTGHIAALHSNKNQQGDGIDIAKMNDLKPADIYKELRLRGYEYGPTFQGIEGADITGRHGMLQWKGNWVTFMDTMLQMVILSQPGRHLSLPTRIISVTVDPSLHKSSLSGEGDGSFSIGATVDRKSDVCCAGGVTIRHLQTTTASRRSGNEHALKEKYTFTENVTGTPIEATYAMESYVQRCSERAHAGLSKLLEVQGTNGLKGKDELKAVVAHHASPAECKDISETEDKGGKSYLGVLSKIFDSDYGHDFVKKAHCLVKEHSTVLKSDPMFSQLLQPGVLKACMGLVVENVLASHVRIMELSDTVILEHVMPLLEPLSLLEPSYTCASTDDTVRDIGVETMKWSLADVYPSTAKKSHLLIANNVLHNQPNIANGLINMLECVGEDGFLLIHEQTNNFHIALPLDGVGEDMSSIEDSDDRSCGRYCTERQWQTIFTRAGLNIIYQRSDGFMSTLFLLKRSCELEVEKQTVVDVTSLDYTWLEALKSELSRIQLTPKGENLWLLADSEFSGVMGLVKCLRQEPGGEKIRCILNLDKDTTLDVKQCLPELCQRDLTMNVYTDGKWGTYCHMSLKPATSQETEHAFLNVLTRGDLSSLRWVQSAMKYPQPVLNRDVCRVHFASLNFRDVMLATGKLGPDAIPGGLANQDCLLGMEFSGYTSAGERVMGLVPFKGLATTVDVRKDFLWRVPDSWTLEQAATIPVVYTTAYYALVARGNLSQGDRVLIHSGTGGVGQAAISIAIHRGCEVFTTVGSTEKREFLKRRFPQLSDDRIFNSRDTLFETNIMLATDGKGVDVVLNSLAGEKLQASLRVLAQHGRFLEIGKVDLSENTALGMSLFLKNVSFHGILLDALFEEGNSDWQIVSRHLSEGIKAGVVQPLQTSVFERDNVEAAFRYMAQGKHIGKVMVKVRDGDITSKASISAMPRTVCDPEKCYIITGGLGGVGLELSNWLVDRGARCLVLTSRSGVATGYQRRAIRYMQSRGVDVIISTRNVRSLDDTQQLFTETNGKPIGGIFHLAMVLEDGFLESQDIDTFRKIADPKVKGAINLDKVSRDVCKDSCDWFVVFSSVVSGRGNAGQTQYGFGNSVMERVCEIRKQDGFHGMAVQWGAIGNVGVAWETMSDGSVVGTLQQSITSCLDALDKFLCQKEETIVFSYVPAARTTPSTGVKPGEKKELVYAVCNILGINDPNAVDGDASLGDIGLDSIMNVEVKHTLEHDFDITLTTAQIQRLTVNKLKVMSTAGVDEGAMDPNNNAAAKKRRTSNCLAGS